MQFTTEQETKRIGDENTNVKRNHVAAKVWSEPLKAYVWVVADEQDIRAFTANGLRGEIYTTDEIMELNCMDIDLLKALQAILLDNWDKESVLEKV